MYHYGLAPVVGLGPALGLGLAWEIGSLLYAVETGGIILCFNHVPHMGVAES